MTVYMLDTNIISDAVRHPEGECARRISAMPPHQLCISIIVASELRFGLKKVAPSRVAFGVQRALEGLRIEPFESPADEFYAEIRATLERTGQLIGGNDLLIAAHSLALNATLVSDNMDEFRRVPGLSLVNWRRR